MTWKETLAEYRKKLPQISVSTKEKIMGMITTEEMAKNIANIVVNSNTEEEILKKLETIK